MQNDLFHSALQLSAQGSRPAAKGAGTAPRKK